MATDPNLSADTCIFMNDGSPDFWLSDDVMITNPASGVAKRGMKNDIRLVVRRKPAECRLPAETDSVKVEVYVCNPTSSPFTPNSTQVKKIADATTSPPSPIIQVTLPTPGSSVPQTIQWDLLSSSTHPAEQPGHKCLIARAYPNPMNASGNSLDFVVDDQHYVQRNICIEICKSPCGVELWTENPEEQQAPKVVTFKVIADMQPSPGVLAVALPLLKHVEGFRQVVNKAPRKGFALELPDFPDAKITDNSRPGCFGLIQGFLPRTMLEPSAFQPSFEAQIVLKPGQLSFYKFATDLDGSEPGDAHVFHLTHAENGRVLSGLTIVMVKL